MYVQMTLHEDNEQGRQKIPSVIELGESEDEKEMVRSGWKDFTSASCSCFNPADKERIFRVINRYPGGVEKFDGCVKEIAAKLWP